MKTLDRLAKEQVNRRLKALQKVNFKDFKVRPAWTKYMRQALGMTLKQLAKRTDLTIGAVAHMEKGEAVGTVSLNTLKKMATAMECEFIYAFVPKEDLNTVLKKAALKKAKQILALADTHMTLEDQRVEQSFDERVNILADSLIEKGDVW